MQITAICTWLTELFLHKLNFLHENSAQPQYKAQYEDVVEEFHHFLSDHKVTNGFIRLTLIPSQEQLNKPTTFNLISSHGRTEDMLYYAEKIDDFERVIAFHIQQQDYKRAITVLADLVSYLLSNNNIFRELLTNHYSTNFLPLLFSICQ